MNHAHLSRALTTLAFAICAFPGQSLAGSGCQSGATHAAAAFVGANPLYAMYFDLDLNVYLARNRPQFRPGGDAVRCLEALSRGFMANAMQLYDPADVQMRQQLNVQLGGLGISPGPQQPSGSSMMYMVSIQLRRLARGLPSAADGDYGPMNTPTSEIEQMIIVAEAMFRQMMPPGMLKEIMAPNDALMRDALRLDYDLVLKAAQRLAKAD